MSKDPQPPRKRRLRTVKQFSTQHQAFTEGGLRWLLFHRETNGLSQAVVQIGRRVLIDVDAFYQWLDTQNDSYCLKDSAPINTVRKQGKATPPLQQHGQRKTQAIVLKPR